ncbi:hypothetical protein B9Z19DRAFT_1105134 [Tuber borchii]|uniref:Proteasome assembly chaperone 3 n=1 Tax=Tuber borchii TaxID=42251 RepID=A0A2T7A6X5_TUBBO|nr:hypothetical protein B9Z19DRAFT_1105134 [Tuber borchii]
MESVLKSPFPASTKRATSVIDGISTESTVVYFADKIMITLSQDGRLAQWFHVSLDTNNSALIGTQSAEDEDGLLPLPHLTPTTLLGGAVQSRESLGQLIAAQLASAISMRNKDEGRMVVLGLGLKKEELERDGFIQLIELVGKCL